MEKLGYLEDFEGFSYYIGGNDLSYRSKKGQSPQSPQEIKVKSLKKGSYNPKSIKVPQETEVENEK